METQKVPVAGTAIFAWALLGISGAYGIMLVVGIWQIGIAGMTFFPVCLLNAAIYFSLSRDVRRGSYLGFAVGYLALGFASYLFLAVFGWPSEWLLSPLMVAHIGIPLLTFSLALGIGIWTIVSVRRRKKVDELIQG
ncbi:MAG: hypothetical protein KAV00_08685 [Phycisphaerae bacterium]|nr:hypothetical protein [Phycisphaerae bacterium]